MPSHRMELPYRNSHSSNPNYGRERDNDYDARHRSYSNEDGRRYSGDIGDVEPRDRSGGYRQQRRSPRVSFEEAFDQLFHTLDEALRFFEGFGRDFNEEVSGIKPYSTERIQNELWMSKARKSDRDFKRASRDGFGNDFDPRARSADQVSDGLGFESCIERIREDFERAIQFALSPKLRRHERSSSIDVESTNRLMNKVETQYAELDRILNKIYKFPSYINEFVKEAEDVLNYLGKSKNLWQSEQFHPEREGGFGEPGPPQQGNSNGFREPA